MKIKPLCIALLALFAGLPTMAQENTISPYSRYGIGMKRDGRFVRNFGMAGAGYALNSNTHINPQNPATYHQLKLTSFEAALEGNNTWLESGDQSQFENKTYFSHLLFGMPVTKWWGMSFGMMPISTVGYNYETTGPVGDEIGSVTNLFEGNGGVNRILFGHGFKLHDRFSAGFNASYLLGNLSYRERIIFNDLGSTFNTRKIDEYAFGDVYFDFGVQHNVILNNGLKLTTGATFASESKINTKRTLVVTSYTGNIGFERIKDTIASEIDKKTPVQLPNFVGFGFALEKEDEWTVTLEGDYSDWSNASFNQIEDFSDAYSIRAGMEIQGNDTRKKGGRVRSNQFHYRFGGRYSSSYITLGGDPVKEMAATIGLSVYKTSKVGSQQTTRGLNLGMEIGTRGDDTSSQIKENFFNFIVGITINDRWFIKRKYN